MDSRQPGWEQGVLQARPSSSTGRIWEQTEHECDEYRTKYKTDVLSGAWKTRQQPEFGLSRALSAHVNTDIDQLYLIAGCEIILNVNATCLKMLQKVQRRFLRRMLGIGSCSMRAVLYSETGIWPIKYRRVYLALKNLCHLIALNGQDRPAYDALQDSLTLARNGHDSWAKDLYEEIAGSEKVKDLLATRLEWDSEEQKLRYQTLTFRHYLRVKTAAHRIALTRMILSSHSLAIERRRWKERRKDKVLREWRLCRFCKTEVEDPAHTLFLCDHRELTRLRETFLEKLYAELPEMRRQFNSPVAFLAAVLEKRAVTPLLAKLAYDVTKIYDSEPIGLSRMHRARERPATYTESGGSWGFLPGMGELRPGPAEGF
ncbi:hypothetical protein C8F01DRAFT_1083160 [Mycena amicta]|nr:hypothetical protein C8F01DRAFT_1083160 [Mycena amicta]